MNGQSIVQSKWQRPSVDWCNTNGKSQWSKGLWNEWQKPAVECLGKAKRAMGEHVKSGFNWWKECSQQMVDQMQNEWQKPVVDQFQNGWQKPAVDRFCEWMAKASSWSISQTDGKSQQLIDFANRWQKPAVDWFCEWMAKASGWTISQMDGKSQWSIDFANGRQKPAVGWFWGDGQKPTGGPNGHWLARVRTEMSGSLYLDKQNCVVLVEHWGCHQITNGTVMIKSPWCGPCQLSSIRLSNIDSLIILRSSKIVWSDIDWSSIVRSSIVKYSVVEHQ